MQKRGVIYCPSLTPFKVCCTKRQSQSHISWLNVHARLARCPRESIILRMYLKVTLRVTTNSLTFTDFETSY